MTIRRAAAVFAALAVTSMLPQATTASAQEDSWTGANAADGPTPPRPPTITSRWSKEGAYLRGQTKAQTRLQRPGSTNWRHRPGGPGGPDHPTQDAEVEYGWRSGPVDDATQRLIDRRLNEGICGPRLPDGTVEGPARCDDWVPRNRPTVEQAVDEIRTQIRTQAIAVRFPQLPVKVQPAGRTLVNLDTILYTDAKKLSTSNVTLLGYPVVIEGTPVSYTWSFGDGSAPLTTATPGKPYPSKEITHKYMKRGAVSVSLTTHYGARFNVAGTGWQYIDGTVPITGPATPLLVQEAVPVLVDPPN